MSSLLFGPVGVAIFPGEIGASLGSRATFEELVQNIWVFEFLTVFFDHLWRVFPHGIARKVAAETAIDGDWRRNDVFREGRFFPNEINSRNF
ncbi:MAG: hypothetical protein L0Y60_07520 [Beijerinckiaceae bacterium]|nr:hypothetical protein [Beijerinckiaceae bacterium]